MLLSASLVNIYKFQFDWEFKGHGFVSRRLLCATLVKKSQLVYFIFIFIYHCGLYNYV